MAKGQCRFCSAPLRTTFIDLGMSPLCQDILSAEDLDRGETFYPLHVFRCDKCMLVQLQDYVGPERIFSEYAYFSSYSDTLLRHSDAFADSAVRRFGLGSESQVVEVASNDGYLLQFFRKHGAKVLGIEPAANVAKVATDKGIPTVVRFFGVDTARAVAADGIKADLLCANNVLPHVPDINDFTGGIKAMLKPNGVAAIEFQHVMRMMEGLQFDTIYQEHFSYLTFTFVEKLFAHHGLTIFDVEEIPTHGGSLRVFARHAGMAPPQPTHAVAAMLAEEERRGLNRPEAYADFRARVEECKRGLLDFLIRARREGKTIVGYGAAGKTNTLLNYCGIRTDFIDYTVDKNPYKQGRFLPGTHIPVHRPERLRETKPDYLFIGVWNMVPEVMEQTAFIREWGGKWIVPIPSVRILD